MERTKWLKKVEKNQMLPKGVMKRLHGAKKKRLDSGQLNLAQKYKNRNLTDLMMPMLCMELRDQGSKIKHLDEDANKHHVQNSLGCNHITSIGAYTLFRSLRKSGSTIEDLVMMRNVLDVKCMKQLGKYVVMNTSIKSINIHSCSISDKEIEILAPYVAKSLNLKYLDIGGNLGITNSSHPLLLSVAENGYIERINITGTSIYPQNLLLLPLVNTTLKNHGDTISFINNGLVDEDIDTICGFLKKYGCDNLKWLTLNKNRIKSSAVSKLMDLLTDLSPPLLILSLSENRTNDECVKSISDFLHSSTTLSSLVLRKMRVTDAGFTLIAEALIGNEVLKHLDISGNLDITNDSFPILINIINKSYLTTISAEDTSISEENINKLYIQLSIPVEEREVPIKSVSKSAAKKDTTTPATLGCAI